MSDTMTKLQEYSFQIIASAGDAKASAYEALRAAKKHDKKAYEENIENAEKNMNDAHKIQFELLTAEANNELKDVNFSILLVHAQDHLMTVMSTIELIKEISEIYLNGKDN